MGKSKILIVDEDRGTLIFLNLFLGKKFDIETCRTDEEFYEAIKKDAMIYL